MTSTLKYFKASRIFVLKLLKSFFLPCLNHASGEGKNLVHFVSLENIEKDLKMKQGIMMRKTTCFLENVVFTEFISKRFL